MKTSGSTAQFSLAHSAADIRTRHGISRRTLLPLAEKVPLTLSGRLKKSPRLYDGASDLETDGSHRTRLSDLCNSLEQDEHIKLRNHLATMSYRVAAASAAFGDSNRRILEIDRIYGDFRRRLWAHMFREDDLYSSIRNLEGKYIKPLCGGSLLIGRIRAMRREHRHYAKVLRRIAVLLREYELPHNVPHTYRELIHGFRELEAFKLRHMESEVDLYSRALAFERLLMGN